MFKQTYSIFTNFYNVLDYCGLYFLRRSTGGNRNSESFQKYQNVYYDLAMYTAL